jgi:hypothetical protein
MKRLALLVLAGVLTGALACGAAASTITLGFECITGGSAANAAIGESQLFVQIVDHADRASFIFSNTGPSPSTIAEIYFDDVCLLDRLAEIVSPAGVVFENDATPHNLPGGRAPQWNFIASPGLVAQACNPAPKNGVNPGEQVELVMLFRSGKSWSDLLNDIASGDLRMGLHVISIGCNGDSCSFINTPEPATLLLMTAGLFAAGVSRRKKVYRRTA